MANIATATSVSSTENVVVILDKPDTAINLAISVLKDELQSTHIVKYDSFNFVWISSFQRVYNYILVGHGVEDGVIIDGKVASWQFYANIVNKLHSIGDIYLLNCNSKNIEDYQLVNLDTVKTFGFDIDARSASLYTSAIINAKTGLIDRAINQVKRLKSHVEDLSNGLAKFIGLGLDGEERWKTGAMFLLLAIVTAIEWYIHVNHFYGFLGYSVTGNPWLAMAFLTFLTIHYLLASYEIPEATLLMAELLIEAADNGLVSYLRDHLAWYEWVAYGAIFIGFIALSILTAGSIMAVNYSIVAASWVVWGAFAFIDFFDCGNTYKFNDGCSSNPPPGVE